MAEKELSFFDHLEELRKRVIIIILAVIASSAALFPFMPRFIEILRQNLINVTLHSFSPMEAIFVTFKASIYGGVVVSSPLIIYEIWAFVSPGLTGKERKMIITALIPTIFLFLAGACFAYFLILPVTLKFFFSFSYRMSTPLFGLDNTLSFVFSMLFIFGAVFQFPLVIAVLTQLGVITHEVLTTKRKYALVIIFVVAGIITPDPTVVSQTLVGVPLYALFEVSIVVARLIERRKKTS
ncbi:MAG: twin-arginine translocase subunit TatC [Theionarchaea archaeon]|nr:twin-arginine translocase subunit TatC [Theionarchaea archaeon]